MLDPRRAIGPPPVRSRSAPAIATTSSIAPAASAPSLAPWPRASKASAARPPPAAARAKSWWFSFRESAPCRSDDAPGAAPRARTARRKAVEDAGLDGRLGVDGAHGVASCAADHGRGATSSRTSTRWDRGWTSAGGSQIGGLRRDRAGAGVRHAGVTSSPRTTCGRGRGPSCRPSPPHTDDFEVLFASKAFPCTAVYRVLAEEGIGCDVASGGELATALRGGFAPERILPARQREDRGRAALRAGRRASATSSSTASTSSTSCSASCPPARGRPS